MTSNNSTAKRSTPPGVRFAASCVFTLFILPVIGHPQPGEDLSDIVFEPVLLSTVAGLPVDFEGMSAEASELLLKRIDHLLGETQELQRADSSSRELIESLVELGLAYQQLDRHAEAVATLDSAIALTVENNGNENLEQIPLHEQKIPSYLAMDSFSSIDDTEELIYRLKSENFAPSSREMYYATINLADWNTAAYFLENYRDSSGRGFGRLRTVLRRAERDIRFPGRASSTGSDDEIQLPDIGGLEAIFSGEIRGVSKLDIIHPRLRSIDQLYSTYQNAVADSGSGEFDIAIDIAKRIARLAHLTKQEMDYERDNYSYDREYEGSLAQTIRTSQERMDESYDTGRQALQYMLDLLLSAEGLPPEAIAAGLMDLGDWHIAYGQVQAARETYRDAWRALIDAGFTASNINRAMTTPMPQRVPLFATHLYSRASAGIGPSSRLNYKGYTDIAFAVDERGNGVDLEFLGNSGANTERIEKMIEIQFRSIKFRPVLRDGELQHSGRYELRYNYSY